FGAAIKNRKPTNWRLAIAQGQPSRTNQPVKAYNPTPSVISIRRFILMRTFRDHSVPMMLVSWPPRRFPGALLRRSIASELMYKRAKLIMIYQPPTIIIPSFAQYKVYGHTILDLFRRRCCSFTADYIVRKTHAAGQKFISERAAGHEYVLETGNPAKDR